jgi:formylglycine-generating enzyme required for sulfatase activity
MEYCRWLSLKTGKAYRLPTEAEWEWACRAGTTGPFSFGSDLRKLDEFAWFEGNSEDVPHPVGTKKPNRWGLHDMHGNVCEWCLDHYQKDRYSSFLPEKITLGPVKLPTAECYPHVARGGCYQDRPERCRCAARRSSDPRWNRSEPQVPPSIWWLADADFVGFRVVRAVEEQENLRGIRSLVTIKR